MHKKTSDRIVIFVLAAECDGSGILFRLIGFEQNRWGHQGPDLKLERA
jgi:hypothetical protein